MSVYLDDYAVEAKLDGTNWTDITADVVDNIDIKYGIFGNSVIDRIGDPGEMRFKLNNSESNSGGVIGYYTPGHPSVRTGFNIGLKIRLLLTFDNVEKVKFYGTIPPDGISIMPGIYSSKRVSVTVVDWMHKAAAHELKSPAFTTNKTITEIVALILANMEIQPLSTNYRTGTETFGAVFDTVKSTTKAYLEMSKVALSELGYIYITRRGGDEVLKVEGRYTRNDEGGTLQTIPIYTDDADYLTTEADEQILTEDGNYYLVLEGSETPSFDNSMFIMTAPYGKDLYNRIKITTYPRIIDAAATSVLFALNTAVLIEVGNTKTLDGRYRDPTGVYNQVAGTDMQTPVATTDYTLNANDDGSGADLTANLSVTAAYGSSGVSYTLENTGGTDGYVTKLQARGKGIYTPDPVDYVAEDSTSISEIGPSQLNINMKYQDDPTVNAGIATVILQQTKDPKINPTRVAFFANRIASLMMSFMYLEPGDRVNIKETVTDTDDDYFIQGVEARIKPGGLISFYWYVKNAGYDTYDYGEWDTDDWDTGLWAF